MTGGQVASFLPPM